MVKSGVIRRISISAVVRKPRKLIYAAKCSLTAPMADDIDGSGQGKGPTVVQEWIQRSSPLGFAKAVCIKALHEVDVQPDCASCCAASSLSSRLQVLMTVGPALYIAFLVCQGSFNGGLRYDTKMPRGEPNRGHT